MFVSGGGGRVSWFLVSLLLVALSVGLGTGCRRTGVEAQVTYGPFGPVKLTADLSKTLMASVEAMPPAASGGADSTAWPLEITFSSRSEVTVVTVWPEVTIRDGQPRGTTTDARALAESVRAEFAAGLDLPGAMRGCDRLHLGAMDETALELSLATAQRETLAQALTGLALEDPANGLGGAPYPGYTLTLTWREVPATIDFTGREYLTLWSKGVFDRLTWRDPETRVWNLCATLLPAPPPEQRTGLKKLFSATADVVASGGNLGQPVTCSGSRAPTLVRILLKGQAATGPAPAGVPITITFSDGKQTWEVYLYQDGFIFEGQYYRLDGIEKTLLAAMHALSLGLGTGHPRTGVEAQVTYGPFGPVKLTADLSKTLMASVEAMPPAASGSADSTAWPLEITFSSRSEVTVVTVWPEVTIRDGQPRGTTTDARALAESVRAEFAAGLDLPGAMRGCDRLHLGAMDETALELSLATAQRETLAQALTGLALEDPANGLGGAPYPGYTLTLTWREVPATIDFTGREYLTLWSKGVFDRLTWRDPETRAWNLCATLLPAPPPEQRTGLNKLFSATASVVASGGNLGQPVTCSGSRVPTLVRILLKGQAATGPAPTGVPITVTFSDGQSTWKVSLYPNGFVFEGQYYLLDGIERTLLTTMNAG
jgi:uncharacterized protein YejL (UPF0352 family)